MAGVCKATVCISDFSFVEGGCNTGMRLNGTLYSSGHVDWLMRDMGAPLGLTIAKELHRAALNLRKTVMSNCSI